MNLAAQRQALIDSMVAVQIRLQGRVQGVGMRPTIWRLANEMALQGQVHNDGSDVLIDVWNGSEAADEFMQRLYAELPPLAVIHHIEQDLLPALDFDRPSGFDILPSNEGESATVALPDAASCEACLNEIRDPDSRRYRYAFTNCTHCGPRLSIQNAVPWDRAHTGMAGFKPCPGCQSEYEDPADRRFHAQPIACPDCGPQLQLVDVRGEPLEHHNENEDSISATAALIKNGAIVAIKGLGGFHLACDASNEAAVARLRAAKQRESKPFALMASNLDMVAEYCELDELSRQALASTAAPIVLLPLLVFASGQSSGLATGIAPGLNSLGMMLPATPLHHLLLDEFKRPLVMTSGNLSAAPPCIDNSEAREKLANVADAFLLHDREISNRLDDSVVRPMAGSMRVFRMGRGYAPECLALPPGFESPAPVLAMGGELKATFCLLTKEGAVLGQHIGDLEEVHNLDDYDRALARYQDLFRFKPQSLAVDRHPEYLSRKAALKQAAEHQLPVVEVQHHHAHIAACMAENAVPLNAAPVLGIALDGLGFGEDEQLWGGEFLLADYQGFQRLACLQPMPLPGAAQAMREPWRNTYAHLVTSVSPEILGKYSELELLQWLQNKPLDNLDKMIERSVNSPLNSSAGRWFDAVAGALDICRTKQDYEGQAAMQLESIVDQSVMRDPTQFYPFGIVQADLPMLSPASLWPALLHDLQAGVAPAVIAARFHGGFAQGLVQMVRTLAETQSIHQIALSGGVFQNRVLFEWVESGLQALGLKVLSHQKVPPNDGGLALGQAMIAAALQTPPTGSLN